MAQNGETRQYSLKEREYVGDDGQIHYHTNVYMERHGLGSGRDESEDEGGSRGQRASGSRGKSSDEGGSRGERTSSSRGKSEDEGGSRGQRASGSRGKSEDEGGSRGQRASGSRGGSRSGGRSGGARASGSRGGSSTRESGSARESRSGREEESGMEGGGTARAILTAAGFGLAAVAAAAFVTRQLDARREAVNAEPDIQPRDDRDQRRGMD